ncbi:hypothetical protein G9A89_010756 [Geosiphon pyriformis]|nr:hypothetical protein G9A89_010756 [Geosiphon pyriformis]
MESEDVSVSEVFNIENMNNIVAKEMSYVNSNDSEADNMVDDTTLRKTRTRMYVLGQPPKKPFFNNASNVDNVLELPPHMFNESNQLSPVKSCVSETHSFNSTKFFALNVEHSAVSGKSISKKLIFLKKIFYQVDGFRSALTLSKFPGVIRLIFTSESSLNKTKLMAINKKVVVNTDLRKVNSHTD